MQEGSGDEIVPMDIDTVEKLVMALGLVPKGLRPRVLAGGREYAIVGIEGDDSTLDIIVRPVPKAREMAACADMPQ